MLIFNYYTSFFLSTENYFAQGPFDLLRKNNYPILRQLLRCLEHFKKTYMPTYSTLLGLTGPKFKFFFEIIEVLLLQFQRVKTSRIMCKVRKKLLQKEKKMIF